MRYGLGQRFREGLRTAVTLSECAGPVPLLGKVDELKVARERARNLLCAIDGPRLNQASGRTLVLVAVARCDDRTAQAFHVLEQLRPAELAEDLPEKIPQQSDLAAQRGGHLNPRDLA